MAKGREEEMRGEELENSGSDPRVYELGFHLDSELPVEEVKKAYQDMRGRITGEGLPAGRQGTVVAEGEPEKIPLAYTISRQDTSGRRDFDSAYFSWIAYEATPRDHAEVLTAANADKRVIRFIDILTTKEAVRHAVEMREFSEKQKAPERVEEPEVAASAELDAALENVVV